MGNFFLSDRNILILIFLNAIVIFISGFDLSPEVMGVLTILDAFFTIIFIVEMVVKLQTWGKKKYFGSSWNVFDFIIVVISMPSLLAILFNLDFGDISFLLIFRTLRVFKVFRFFNFIPGIDNLLSSIKRGFKASVLILVSFTVFLFVVSILSNNLFGDSEVYNNPARALYTTVQLISIEGWHEIPEAIQEDIPTINVFFTRLYFVSLLIIGGIFGLSFVDAVLVDTMVADNNDNLEVKVDELKDEIRALRSLIEKP